MYVIGTSQTDFIKIKSNTIMGYCNIWFEIEHVTYGCSMPKASVFTDYERAIKVVEEIKNRKDEIRFENDSIIGEILDREKDFDVDRLNVYRLVPQVCE